MLYVTIFLTGAIIMIVELVGIRLFAPYFGSTMDIVTGIISTVLAALGLGYYVGGRLADNNPSTSILIVILVLASFILIGSFAWSNQVLTTLSQFKEFRIILVIACSTILMGPTSLLLAMISPYALRLQLNSIKATGSIAGATYSVGTIGSIVGTLIAGYLLIPNIPLDQIILYSGITLFIWAMIFAIKIKLPFNLLILYILIILVIAFIYKSNRKTANVLYSVESKYSNIQVREGFITEEGIKLYGRFIYLNNRCCESGMNIQQPHGLYFKYLNFFVKGTSMVSSPKSFLIIGGGGYTFPKYVLHMYPKALVDVVEIDPAMTFIAQEYFQLPTTYRLRTIEEDGRVFLNANRKAYNVIAVDVAQEEYSIPFPLFTQEAVYKIKESLDEKGVVLVNILSAITGPNSTLFASTYKTYSSVFGNVSAYKVYTTPNEKIQNIVLLATKSNKGHLTDDALFKTSRITPEKDIMAILLKDNFAPVERMLLP